LTKTTKHLSSIIGNLESAGWTTLRLEDVVLDLDIGAHEYEKGVKQPVRFDIEVLLEGSEPPKDDQIGNVLDYEYLHHSIESATSRRHSLMETIASSILETILLPENVVAGVVSLTKISPIGFDGKFGCTLARVKTKSED
jgi:dihydroneopterin aldolase|tara:strand:+ start:4142 stop:4561 length:420 start_codon:yes stop_codon:yes gene_type:complete